MWILNPITGVLLRDTKRKRQTRNKKCCDRSMMWNDVTIAQEAGDHQKLEEAWHRFSPRASVGNAALPSS